MSCKNQRDQKIALNKDEAAGEKTEIVYSCAGPRICDEGTELLSQQNSVYYTPNDVR